MKPEQLSLSNFHGQLLRVVYRLIFLFVAEDRTLDGISLLHPRDDSEAARQARESHIIRDSSCHWALQNGSSALLVIGSGG